jgi:hypothetical protein
MPRNSGDDFFLGLYSAMLVDIVRRRPSLRVECERDYKRLLSVVERHGGHRIFCDFLPALGKYVDTCLATGLYVQPCMPLSKPYKRASVIPRLFRGLYLAVFDDSGVLRSSVDALDIADLRQVLTCLKRFRAECDPSYVYMAVEEYFQIDREVRPPSLSWGEDELVGPSLNTLSLEDNEPKSFGLLKLLQPKESPLSFLNDGTFYAIQFVADCVTSELGRFYPAEWKAQHGPGAVADAPSRTDKYLFPTWPAKLDRIFPYADWAFSSVESWADTVSHDEDSLSVDSESPAKLIAVPKEFTKPRLIASEPTAHQWCQQAIRKFLMSRVNETCIADSIHFRDQNYNAELALEASHSGSHATIDLSSASDRISCWMVERLFRRSPSLLNSFHAVRTRYITNGIDKKSPKLTKLRKFSTMGSALTFPVQTYAFTMIAIGCLLKERELPYSIHSIRRLSREVRVFGDDIIVPLDCSNRVQEVLVALGLRVNRNKTFDTGKFRESCGCDAYDGHDVTRISVNVTPAVSSPESVISTVDTHNNLYSRGWMSTAEYLKRRVVEMKRYCFMPIAPGSGDVGWYDLAWWDRSSLKRRWNPSLQRVEFRVAQLYSRPTRNQTSGRSMLLQYFTEGCLPSKFLVRELGLVASISRPMLRPGWVAGAG